MRNTRLFINKQIKFIYTKIADLKAYDPHRTSDQARAIAQCGITRCYVLIDFTEAAELDGIITEAEKIGAFHKVQEAHNELVKLQNNII